MRHMAAVGEGKGTDTFVRGAQDGRGGSGLLVKRREGYLLPARTPISTGALAVALPAGAAGAAALGGAAGVAVAFGAALGAEPAGAAGAACRPRSVCVCVVSGGVEGS